jgi:hypothetical protein
MSHGAAPKAQASPVKPMAFRCSAILSRPLGKHQGAGNDQALTLITSTSPTVWRQVYLNGRYGFRVAAAVFEGLPIFAVLTLHGNRFAARHTQWE